MKHIGIITFQNANNYGAVFQAFALQKTVEKLGAKAEILNYDSPNMGLKSVQTKVFSDFTQKYLNLTAPYTNKKDIETTGFDAVISGSDQVWNPRLTGSDMTYFLDFVGKDVKKLSYAASIGLNEDLFLEYKEVFEKYVPEFEAVSLREETHVPYIKSIVDGNKQVITSIDPSLLLTAGEYAQAFGLKETQKEEYIFVFSYAYDPKLYDFANMLSLKTGYKIVALTFYNAGSFVDGASVLRNVPPVDWLQLFNDAKMVITDSFHGMMFSMIFNKPFYAYTPNRSNVARVTDVLKKFGLEDRKLTNIQSIKDVSFELNYAGVNQKIEAEREKSLQYLREQMER